MMMARRFGERQTEALRAAFEESDHPSRERKAELVAETGLDVEQITAGSAGETVSELEVAQEALRMSWGREAELQRQVAESRHWERALEEDFVPSTEQDVIFNDGGQAIWGLIG